MSDTVTIKIKRRASTGSAGAPASLKSGELAFNENASDKKLYYGYGDDGSGGATSIVAIGGEGAYVTLDTAQSISGDKIFSGNVTLTGATIALNTNQLTESGNLFFTEARARAAISGDASTGLLYNNSTGVVVISGVPNNSLLNSAITINGNSISLGSSATFSTSEIGEGTNLYYTDARARAAISGDASTGFVYSSSTGTGSLSAIPNASLANSTITVNGVAIALGGSVSTNVNISDGSSSTSIANNGTITVQGTASEVTVGNNNGVLTVGLPDNVIIASGLTVGGDLTVNGSLTSINSTTVTVDDKNIELGATESPSDATADGGGITLKGTTDKKIEWISSTSSWTFNQNVNVTTGGYSIGGTQVLTASRQLINVTLSGIVIDGGTF
jgi:hypothetical protein